MEQFIGESGRTWRYEPTATIGEKGGMGSVFEGLSDSDETIAVKRIIIDSIRSENSRQDREIEIGGELDSLDYAEHVLKRIDWAEENGYRFIVMPRATQSLAKVLLGESLRRESISLILRQICLGLIELQKVNILHRDLKPANVLQVDGNWKLADFGISRNSEIETATLTYKGFGTPQYMAPEIWEGGTADFRSDLYSLGIIAYQLIEGKVPFDGASPASISLKHRTVEPPVMSHASPQEKSLILRLLSKSPLARPLNASDLLIDLDKLLNPMNPALDTLRQVRAEKQERDAKREAAERAYYERIQTRENVQKAAQEDLMRILELAVQESSEEFSDLTLVQGAGGSILIQCREFILTVNIWEIPANSAIEGKADPLLLAGTVYARTVPGFPIANVACNFVENHFDWKILQFRENGGLRTYDYGPRNRPHGFSRDVFSTQRSWMFKNGMHVWTMEVTKLDFEGLLPLIEIALGRDDPIE